MIRRKNRLRDDHASIVREGNDRIKIKQSAEKRLNVLVIK
jgi:hypothetical protein